MLLPGGRAARRGERPLIVNSSYSSSSSSSIPALVKVVVAVDGSPSSLAALAFACRWCSGGGALAGRATLLLASAVPLTPFPVAFDADGYDAPSSAVAASYGAERWEQEKEAAATAARASVEAAKRAAVDQHGVDARSVETAVVPDGGSQSSLPTATAAEALIALVESTGAHVVVAGSRGLGAWRSAALSLVGMGSVSSGLLHGSKVPVVVVKSAEEEEVIVRQEGSA